METALKAIGNKFDSAEMIIKSLPDNKIFQEATSTLLGIKMRFTVATLLSIQNKDNSAFMRILASGNFANDIDRVIINLQEALKKELMPKKSKVIPIDFKLPSKYQDLFHKYPMNSDMTPLVMGSSTSSSYEKCICGGEMKKDISFSKLTCQECSIIKEIDVINSEDIPNHIQDNLKSKTSMSNPIRHFRHWWQHILAREPEEEIGDKMDPDNFYGEKVIEELKAILKSNRKVLRSITVDDMREMLKEINRTDLNKNISLLMKKLTGIGPPDISLELEQRAENIFMRMLEVGDMNHKYHPHYIFHIMDNIIAQDDFETRRMLFYIYLQSQETIENNDVDLKIICSKLGGDIIYKPTDRNLGKRYIAI